VAKGVTSKAKSAGGGFLREVSGLALILFSLLTFVCVVTGDGLFYTLGLNVRNFLFGVFGVYTFIFLIHTTMAGIALVYGKLLVPKGKRLTAMLVRAAYICVFLLLHLFISFREGLTFGAQLTYAFGAPFEGALTVGGWAASLIVTPVTLLVGKVGAIILFILLTLVVFALLFRERIRALIGGTAIVGAKPRGKKTAENGDTAKKNTAESDETVSGQKKVSNFFFNEKSGFGFREKDKNGARPERRIAPFSGRFETKNIIDYARQDVYEAARAEAPRVDERAARGETGPYRDDGGGSTPFYPDRSARSGVSRYNKSPMRFTDDEDRVEKRSAQSEYDASSRGKDVYTVHGGARERAFADDAEGGYERTATRGGMFDGASGKPESDGRAPTFADVDRRTTAEREVYTPPVSARIRSEQTEKTERVEEEYTERETTVKKVETTPAKVDAEPVDGSAAKVADGSAARGYEPRTDTRASEVPPTRVRAAFDAGETAEMGDDDYDDESGYAFIPEMPLNYKYTRPKLDMLTDYTPDADAQWEERKRQDFCKSKILTVLKNNNIDATIENVVSGSSVTRYDISIPDEASLSDVKACKNELAFRLKATGKFNLEALPGTDLIGIEVASSARRTVGMKNVFEHRATKSIDFNKGMYFMLGEEVLGTPVFLDLMKMPHLLICGATGTGKSVCLNTLLMSLIYSYSPEDLRLIIVDPKRVEFNAYEGIPHLVFNSILSFDESGKSSKVVGVLEWAVQEMDRRYKVLAEHGYKDIKVYNAAIDRTKQRKIPYIVILIDEFADFVMADPDCKKQIDWYIGRLAQKARAAGVSIILATQRPTSDLVSGNIKTNITSRICFKTSSALDSRVVLEDGRAEQLLDRGDCYFRTTTNSTLTRAQGAFVSDEDIFKVVRYIKENNKCYFDNSILERINKAAARSVAKADDDEDLPSPKSQSNARMSLDPNDADEVKKRAIRIAITLGSISTSKLRSYMSVGYNKANFIIIWMERMGYITAPLENQMRQTIITREQYENTYGEFTVDF